MAYTNSKLANYKLLSPSANHYGARTHAIDRITPHMVVGQCTVESLGALFNNASRGATSNYGVGYDGKIGLYCEEKNAAGTSSSYANDNRAVTIEIASDNYYPYKLNDAAYNAAIQLMADICQRNGKTKLLWLGKDTALSYSPKADEMVITFHKWFASTACPGFYIEEHIKDMVAKVNAILSGTPVKKTVVEIAQEVIDKKWGNGQARKDALTDAGYNATTVQAQVDRMLAKDGYKMTADKLVSLFPTVKEGSEGTAVEIVQTWLKEAGYYTGTVDGQCGSGTVAAIKQFQTNIGTVYGSFAVDGCFGPACWKRIL